MLFSRQDVSQVKLATAELLIALNALCPQGGARIWERVRAAGLLETLQMEDLHRITTSLLRDCVQGKEIDLSALVVQERGQALAVGARVLTWVDEEYPERLKNIAVPPLVLYVRGTTGCLGGPAIAVVGTRSPSEHGRVTALRLGRQFAQCGFVVVSGLALGIDGLAHTGALEAGGITVGVQGRGLADIYPASHRGLAARIVKEGGAIITEFPMQEQPRKENFPQRNRIISGVSHGVVVVEAGEKSGALITARFAAEQGRSVYALPGYVTSPAAAGTNRLLMNGAQMILSAEDAVLDLAPQLGSGWALPVGGEVELRLSVEEKAILDKLGGLPMSPNELARCLGLSPEAVLRVLTVLELGGYVRQDRGGLFART